MKKFERKSDISISDIMQNTTPSENKNADFLEVLKAAETTLKTMANAEIEAGAESISFDEIEMAPIEDIDKPKTR